MTGILLDQQYIFTYFIGPWINLFFAVAVAGGICETILNLFMKPVTIVRGRDDLE